MKLSLKKSWLCSLIKDLSPTSVGSSKGIVCNGVTKYGHIDKLPNVYKIVGSIFAIIGVLATFRWMLLFIVSLFSTSATLEPVPYSNNEAGNQAPSDSLANCVHNPVFTDISDRVQLLELAFKEQVFARETIAREINDHADVYGSMDRQLMMFLEKLDNVSNAYAQLEMKYTDLANRVYSDETLGTIVMVVLMVQLFCILRPKVLELIGPIGDLKPALKNLIPRTNLKRNASNPGTPKHSLSIKNEACVVCFQRDSANSLIMKLTDAMMRHLEGVKISTKPFYAIFSMEDLRGLPHVRLYVVIIDLESRGLYINGSEKDLVVTTLKYTKSCGLHTVAVIVNDEGSKNLTAHSIYNSTLRMVKTNDILQELAADGRLFSMYQEMTSHQLSHLRRMVKTVLNAKLVMR
ncbi:hypothetical protein ACF0H5_007698 [Mactra antiquata]